MDGTGNLNSLPIVQMKVHEVLEGRPIPGYEMTGYYLEIFSIVS